MKTIKEQIKVMQWFEDGNSVYNAGNPSKLYNKRSNPDFVFKWCVLDYDIAPLRTEIAYLPETIQKYPTSGPIHVGDTLTFTVPWIKSVKAHKCFKAEISDPCEKGFVIVCIYDEI